MVEDHRTDVTCRECGDKVVILIMRSEEMYRWDVLQEQRRKAIERDARCIEEAEIMLETICAKPREDFWDLLALKHHKSVREAKVFFGTLASARGSAGLEVCMGIVVEVLEYAKQKQSSIQMRDSGY